MAKKRDRRRGRPAAGNESKKIHLPNIPVVDPLQQALDKKAFGKFKGQTFRRAVEQDLAWVHWLYRQQRRESETGSTFLVLKVLCKAFPLGIKDEAELELQDEPSVCTSSAPSQLRMTTMDGLKILEVVAFLEARLDHGAKELPPELKAARFANLSPAMTREVPLHLGWMCQQIRRQVEKGELNKAQRWLGFVKGTMWAAGVFSIAELTSMSVPYETETSQPPTIAAEAQPARSARPPLCDDCSAEVPDSAKNRYERGPWHDKRCPLYEGEFTGTVHNWSYTSGGTLVIHNVSDLPRASLLLGYKVTITRKASEPDHGRTEDRPVGLGGERISHE